MNRPTNLTIGLVIFSTIILGLALRGLPGNPTAIELNSPVWEENGPLELSPDRGRYALLYSIVEDRSVVFSLDIARFATPDLAVTPNKNYVSLFAPTLSYIVAPGYIVGKSVGLAQVGAFAVIAVFAILNTLLIRWIAMQVGANPIAATIGALAFLFGTPAFTYAVSLYQHHVTVFMILSSIYVLMRYEGLKPVAYVWFMCALSIGVDNPNLFFMAPVGMYALLRVIESHSNPDGTISSTINPIGIALLSVMLIPLTFFFWYNWSANENPLQLSGTLPAVKSIDAAGKPSNSEKAIEYDASGKIKFQDKSAVGSFRTRNLLQGFYVHMVSPDRGIIRFGPVILFGVIGLYYLYRSHRTVANVLLATLGANILLYSMWGDPWGGWAFGSRYLIPTYALLAVGVGVVLTRWRKSTIALVLFGIVFSYSVWVNTLGAITSSMNPPQDEVLALEKQTNLIEKYTYERNWDLLKRNISKSYVYQTHLKDVISVEQYHMLIAALVSIVGLAGLVWLRMEYLAHRHHSHE